MRSLTAIREKTQGDIDTINQQKLESEKLLQSKITAKLASEQTIFYIKRVLDGIHSSNGQSRSLLQATIDYQERVVTDCTESIAALRKTVDEHERSLQEIIKAAQAQDARIKQITIQRELLLRKQGMHAATVVTDVLLNEIQPQLLRHVNALFDQQTL